MLLLIFLINKILLLFVLFKYNLRDKLHISEIIDIFTCEDIMSSHVRISYCFSCFYQFVTTRYTRLLYNENT